MMHTYLKRTDEDDYAIGLWLLRPEGYVQFKPLFAVKSLTHAIVAINTLNGGTRASLVELITEEIDK
jgi:hypothetical protein